MTRKTKTAKANVVLGYVRVSSQDQADNGQSLEAQSEKIRAYCDMRGLELAGIVVDAAVSGGTPIGEREGGKQVLEALKTGKACGVVAVKLDRLFRSASDCLVTVDAWDRDGVAFHLVDMGGQTVDTSTSAGKLFLTMLSGFAEFERSIIGERTSAVLQSKKARGEVVGTVPFGFKRGKDGVHLEVASKEQAIVARVLELDAAGLSLRAIAGQIGKNPRTSKPFFAQQIKNIIEANESE